MSNFFSGVQGAFKRDMRGEEKRHGLHGDYEFGSGLSMACLCPATAACAGALANIPEGRFLAVQRLSYQAGGVAYSLSQHASWLNLRNIRA